MADDLTLKVSIPKADDKAFLASLNRTLQKLEEVDRTIKRVDKSARGLGKGVGSLGGSSRGGKAGAQAQQSQAPPVPRPAPRAPKNNRSSLGGRGASIAGQALGGNLGRIGAEVGQVAALASSFGKLGLIVGGVAIAVGLLVLGVVKAVKAFTEFEESLGAVARVAQLSEKETIAFGQSVLQISSDLPITTQKIFQFADALANAGLRGSELDQATESFARMGTVVRGLDTSKIQDILRLRELAGLGATFDEVNDKIVRLGQSVTATVPQIVKASAQAAAALAGTGASLDDTLSIGAAVAGQTKRTQRLITSIGKVRQSLASLNTVPDDKLQAILGTLRQTSQISTQAFRDLAAGPEGARKSFEFLLANSTDLRTSLDALGLTANSVGNTLVRSFAKNGKTLEKAQKAIADGAAAGTVEDQAKARLKEFGAQATILGNRFSALFIKIGGGIASFLTPFLSALNTMLAGINSFADGVASAFDLIPDSVKTVVGGILFPLRLVADAFNFIFGGMSDKAEEELKRINKAASDNIGSIVTNTQKQVDKLGDVRLIDFDSLKAGFAATKVLLRASLEEAGKTPEEIKKAIAGLVDPAKAFEAQLAQAARTSDIIAQNLSTVNNEIKGITSEIAKADFELELDDLDPLEKALARIANNTKIKLDEKNFDFDRAGKGITKSLLGLSGSSKTIEPFDTKNLTDFDNTIARLRDIQEGPDAKKSAVALDLINLIETFKGNQDVINQINNLGKKRQELAIKKEFDDTLETVDKIFDVLNNNDLTPLQKQIKDLGKTLDKTFATDKLKRAAALLGRLKINETLQGTINSIGKDIKKLGIDIRQSKLSDFGKGIDNAVRQFQETIKNDIAKPEFGVSLSADSLRRNEEIKAAAEKRRDLAIQKTLETARQGLLKDRSQIRETEAPAVDAVTDVGSAIEAVNQAQRTNDLQEALLEVNTAQLNKLTTIAKDAKAKSVIFPPAR